MSAQNGAGWAHISIAGAIGLGAPLGPWADFVGRVGSALVSTAIVAFAGWLWKRITARRR